MEPVPSESDSKESEDVLDELSFKVASKVVNLVLSLFLYFNRIIKSFDLKPFLFQ